MRFFMLGASWCQPAFGSPGTAAKYDVTKPSAPPAGGGDGGDGDVVVGVVGGVVGGAEVFGGGVVVVCVDGGFEAAVCPPAPVTFSWAVDV